MVAKLHCRCLMEGLQKIWKEFGSFRRPWEALGIFRMIEEALGKVFGNLSEGLPAGLWERFRRCLGNVSAGPPPEQGCLRFDGCGNHTVPKSSTLPRPLKEPSGKVSKTFREGF